MEKHLCAFARLREGQAVLAVVPRFLAHLLKSTDRMPLGEEAWGDMSIVLPDEIPGEEFRNIFTGERVKRVRQNGQGGIALKDIFKNFPVAMLEKI